MKRFRIDLSYDGSNYKGWQAQKNEKTIQGEIQKVLAILFKSDILITGSGRTDSGVHAIQQVAHVDLPVSGDVGLPSIVNSMNGMLPSDIHIKSIHPVRDDFHARFDAKSRQYLYQIGLDRDVFNDRYCWRVFRKVDLDLLNIGASKFLGTHNFSSFSKKNPDIKNYYCTIDRSECSMGSDNILRFRIRSNRFLHHMVRSIVGTLVDIATRKRSLDHIDELLLVPDHANFTAKAPANALFLEEILY